MNSELPAPPYPETTVTKGWRFELDLPRIWKSDTWVLCPADMRPWLYHIWAVAFEQQPAGSLPKEHALIAAHIGMESRMFTVHAEILLRGFSLHSDGRLYHPAVTERVMALLSYRDLERERKAKYRNSLKNKEACPAGQTRDRRGIPVGETLLELEQEQELGIPPLAPPAPTAKPKRSPSAHGTRLSMESLPPDWRAWTREHCQGISPERTWETFRDYWVAKPGKDGAKADWFATWRNWCRRETDRVAGNTTSPPPRPRKPL